MTKENKDEKVNYKLPFVVSISFALGIWLGASLFTHSGKGNDFGKSANKLREVFGILESEYVDSIDQEQILETTLSGILNHLDPHSTYIPTEEIEFSKSSLESGFEGIGAEFSILNDTVEIVSTLKNGPSDLAGVLPGDKVIGIGGDSLKHPISTKDIFLRLRGPKGSMAEVEILRGVNKKFKLSIPRAQISSTSIDASFLLSNGTGYLKISKFSDNTFTEALKHLSDLKAAGAHSFLLDVRDNTGGYLDRATKLAEEFLPENQLILFTEGKAKKYNQKYFSSGKGHFLKEPLLILVDEGSASASEILAGAIQDNDRGLIVGRRTFGKGLVQVPISLKDGSELRLTISRYFTPSGRCIQKPYKIKESDYNIELERRYLKGELFEKDSFNQDKKNPFKTGKGRVVYGSGGITPDIFVPLDTVIINPFIDEFYGRNLFREFSLTYYHQNKFELESLKKKIKPTSLQLKPGTFERFVEFCQKGKIRNLRKEIRTSSQIYVNNMLKAYIAKLLWGDQSYFEIACLKDPVVQVALQNLGAARTLILSKKEK